MFVFTYACVCVCVCCLLSGRTALHWAAAVNNVEALLTLIHRDANKDAQDSYDQTPLFLAAREGSREAIRALLDTGANRDIPDHMDRLPRHTAAERLHLDIAQMLDDAANPPRRYQTPTADGLLLQADCLMSKGKQKKGIQPRFFRFLKTLKKELQKPNQCRFFRFLF